MTHEEELMYGLKRWMFKATAYLGNETIDEFAEDEKTFDAICYCIEIIAEIAFKLKDNKEISEKNKDVNLENLSLIKEKCFVGDNININLIYSLAKNDFPRLISVLKDVK